jgi:hypothetical protein
MKAMADKAAELLKKRPQLGLTLTSSDALGMAQDDPSDAPQTPTGEKLKKANSKEGRDDRALQPISTVNSAEPQPL